MASGKSREPPGPLQPGRGIASARSTGEWIQPLACDQAPLGRLYGESVVDFAYSWGFGYFKDRRHVAGFETHRFSQVPGSWGEQWQVRTLDLVGLLRDDEPKVY